ncbi:oligoendopeptidase F, partial [Streptococcus danieliae]|nr:oligoendopeptidase F [Streptococcus danieliae]
KLSHYATLPPTADRFNEKVIANEQVYLNFYNKLARIKAGFMSEINDLDDNFLRKFIKSKRPDLAYYINNIIAYKKHSLSKEAEEVVSSLESLPSFYNLYEVTKFEDMSFDNFIVNGKEYENSYNLYENIYESHSDKDIRREAAKSFYKGLNAYKNTTANEYICHIKKRKGNVQIKGL